MGCQRTCVAHKGKRTLDEVEVLGDEVLAVVHDENTANVKLNVVALLLGLEEVERRAAYTSAQPHEDHRNTYRLGTKRMALNSS